MFSKLIKIFQKSDNHLSPLPHIFIILADAVYAQHLSVYGYYRNTSPNLNEFSKKSIIFDIFILLVLQHHRVALFTGYYIGNYPNKAKRGGIYAKL